MVEKAPENMPFGTIIDIYNMFQIKHETISSDVISDAAVAKLAPTPPALIETSLAWPNTNIFSYLFCQNVRIDFEHGIIRWYSDDFFKKSLSSNGRILFSLTHSRRILEFLPNTGAREKGFYHFLCTFVTHCVEPPPPQYE